MIDDTPSFTLMNKNGLPVENSAKEVREELLHGEGAVMAEGCSIFMESGNLRDKQIVVARSPESEGNPERVTFVVERFPEAWKKFVEWRRA